MSRFLSFIYGAGSYGVALVTFVYLAGFLINVGVPNAMDSPSTEAWQTAIWIDFGLMLLFAIQHSVMARPAFKRFVTKMIPHAIERSTYVLASSVALLFLFWQWRPLGGTVWEVENETVQMLLYGGYGFGWALLLFATFVINHFDLFGLRQVWRNLMGQNQAQLSFRTPFLYRVVRHPIYVGWLLTFWCTPVMTETHLFFALAMSGYILMAIRFEEKDLIEAHPEYAVYREQVPMLLPGLPKQVQLPREASGVAR